MIKKTNATNKVFINLSNHPSDNWQENQKQEAEKYGEIIDIPFPAVSATASETEIKLLANNLVKDVESYNPAAVMCQGEFTLSYALIKNLTDKGIHVVAACSERDTVESKDASGAIIKTSTFVFKQFRSF